MRSCTHIVDSLHISQDKARHQIRSDDWQAGTRSMEYKYSRKKVSAASASVEVSGEEPKFAPGKTCSN